MFPPGGSQGRAELRVLARVQAESQQEQSGRHGEEQREASEKPADGEQRRRALIAVGPEAGRVEGEAREDDREARGGLRRQVPEREVGALLGLPGSRRQTTWTRWKNAVVSSPPAQPRPG